MKNYLYGIFAIAFLAFTACTNEELPTPGTGQDTPVEHKSGEILVKFSPYVSEILDKAAAATRSGGPATRSGILSVDEVLDIVGGYQIERVFPVDGRNEERTRESELHLWYVVRFGDDYSAEEVAEKLSALGEVQHVNLNRTIRRAYNAGKKAMPLTREALAAMQRATRAAGDTGYPFNDELLPMQWHLINRGNLFGEKSIVDADVQCEEAWKSSTGDQSIIVAVLDEGVMVEHPDLKNNMWVNEGEVYRSKQDNDGNGYKGDVYGYNFVFDTGVISWDDVSDTGHGTHVAGVIAAQNNNGIGISSIAGGNADIPGVKIMSCQIFSGNTVSNSLATVRAIKYAADNGASIIQCSMGIKGGGYTSDDQYAKNAKAEHDALAYFIATSNCDAIDGGLVIFSAGNDALDRAGYPGAFRDYISVTSFSPDFLPASYTNYGPGCNISAPGGDAYIASNSTATVLSTMPSEMNEGSDYGYMQGTSMACPHMSGVAALGLSYALKQGKHYTRNEFISMLLTSVNDMERYLDGTKESNGTMYLENYRKQLGTGAVDAYQLLMQIEGTPCLKVGVGAEELVPLTQFFGGSATNLTYTGVSMSAADMAKLGIETLPTMAYGKLKIKCTKSGVAKITVTAIGGGDKVGTGTVMGGMTITKEFAIIARGVQAGNGGWL